MKPLEPTLLEETSQKIVSSYEHIAEEAYKEYSLAKKYGKVAEIKEAKAHWELATVVVIEMEKAMRLLNQNMTPQEVN